MIEILNRLNPNKAGSILIGIYSVLVVFHLANYFGKIPLNVTWLGQIDSSKTVKIMSLVSILLNLTILFCAVVKRGNFTNKNIQSIVEKLLPFVFWWLVGNTVANLFSKTKFEVVVFTPILVVLTVYVYVIKNSENSSDVRGQ